MRSYIVVVSPTYGGAEKRFFDIFTRLRRSGDDVIFVGPSILLDQLRADHSDRFDVLPALLPVPINRWSRSAFLRQFSRLLQNIPRGANFHYPLNCLWPLHILRGDRVTMSVADCTSVPHPLAAKRTSVLAWLAFFFVSRIDVLSPTVLAAMRKYRTFGKMSLTPGGTFMIPTTTAVGSKLPTVVFLGRLAPGKGVDHFLDAIPELWRIIRERVPHGFEIQIAGYGPLQQHVVDRVESLARLGIAVSFLGYVNSETLLARSAVLVSMQEVTNFPSRVVAEALIAGCGVIVRDTGDSTKFGNDLPGLVYCGGKLDPEELAEKVTSLLERVLIEPGFPGRVHDAAAARFSSSEYIDYFRNIITGELTSASF